MKTLLARTIGLLWGAVVALALLVLPCSAQTYLYNRAIFPTGNTPVAAVAMDFNGDGQLDLAVVNQASNTVSVLLGKAGASFAPKVDYPVGDSPAAIVCADFNGDGKLDLAVVNSVSNNVSILLGNGDGTFAGHVDYATGNKPIGIVAADFNSDGKLDLAVLNQNDNTVSILLGNGDGTFAGQAPVAVGINPVALASGDFNGDGKIDLITSNNTPPETLLSPTVTVLLSKGDGTFTRVNTEVGPEPSGMAVGDFNHDGKLDVVLIIDWAQLSFLEGNGDGSFFQPSSFPILIYPLDEDFSATTLLAVDLNHDGLLDVVAGDISKSAVLLGTGDGTSFQVAPYTGEGLGLPLLSADINGDGVPDLVLGSPFSPGLSDICVALGAGDGTFGSSPDYNLVAVKNSSLTPLNGIDSGPAIAGDFNGDGNTDVAVFEYNEGPGVIAVLLGKGDGSFQAPVSSPMTEEVAGALGEADFNGDGKLDLVAWTSSPYLNTAPSYLSVFLGNGDGTFQGTIHVPTPPNPVAASLPVGDFNGDGKPDLAIATSNSAGTQEAVQILLGQGNGAFTSGASIPLDSAALLAQGIYWAGAVYLTAGDFNHDGRIDIAAAQGQTVAVLLGNGDGTFQTPAYYECGHYFIEAIETADFNGDGKPDLLVSTYDGVSVFLGNGDGTFQPHLDSNFGAGPGSQLAIGNFTGHGKLDLSYSDCIAAANGDGTFQLPQCTPFGATAVAAGDFNSDGITDLALDIQFIAQVPFVKLLLSAPQIALYPSMVNFGTQEVGVASVTQELTVTNIGNAPLSISSIVAGGDFAQTNTCVPAIPVQASCVVSIIFTPTAAGGRIGSITVTDGLKSSPQVIVLSGVGVAPSASLLPGTVTFAAQSMGTTSPAKMVTLTDTGNLPLMISGIAVDSDFAQTNNCTAEVAAGLSCTISVTFTPTADGTRTGHLTVTDNAPDSPQSVALTGSGPDFTLTLPSGSSSSASVSPGQTATYTLSVGGEGGLNSTVTLSCTGAPSQATCTVSPNSVTLGGSATTGTVTVTTTAPSVSPPSFRPIPPVPPLFQRLQVLLLLALVRVAMRWRVRSQKQTASRWRCATLLLATLLLLILALTGCGGGGGGGGAFNAGTPAGTYTLTVIGTSGSGSSTLSHSVPLTLKVT
jgi:hypothetical protein